MATDPCGKRVSVLFDEDEGSAWFDGTVSEFKSKLAVDGTIISRIKIAYDDNTFSKWLDAAAEEAAGQLRFTASASGATAAPILSVVSTATAAPAPSPTCKRVCYADSPTSALPRRAR